MIQRTRRGFLRDVGAGVVVASVGPSLAADLGFSSAFADQGPERLTFGQLEPLVSLMQETPAERLMPLVVERLRGGRSCARWWLRRLWPTPALSAARIMSVSTR